MTATTVIRNVDWLVAWDADAARHLYIRGGDLAFRGDAIVHVGGFYQGEAQTQIDGRSLMAMPGLVDLHAHPSFETMLKGVTEEVGSQNFWMSSLYEYLFLFEIDPPGMRASTEVAVTELLQSGVTSLCDLSIAHEGWLDTLAASGIRAFPAPMFRSGRWFTTNGHRVDYEFSEALGRNRFEEALRLIDLADQHPSGRLSGVVCPAQIDTSDEALLRDAGAEALRRRAPLHIHASQSVVEFHEIMRRHGRTPIGWMNEIGLLGPRTTVGHAIFLDHHDWLAWPSRDDVELLRATRTNVAHCPTVFTRRGITLQHFARYCSAGVNLGIGTDTFPHNFIEEMRTAIYSGRITARNAAMPLLDDVFHAATIGGAAALGRDDIGRLAPGAKADIVLVSLDHPAMRPLRDPLRSLVFSAGERPIRDVYVGGELVVRDGRALAFDIGAALDRVEDAQRRALANVYRYDWQGRTAEKVLPLSHALGQEQSAR